MDYNFSLITLELGIPVMATIISIVGIILYSYIYFQLYEEPQAIILLLGFLSFLFSGLEASNIILSLYSKNNYLALNMYKFEQLALSLTIIPWMMYIRTQLTLSRT
ncbi:methyl-accepting chemotaxis sensory transducer, partial [Brachyspira hampsonii 30599]